MSNAKGLFGPQSATWMVDRETALVLGGPRALLLQIAHPAVAAAVDKHSDFRADPLGRLQRTLDSVFTIVFGDRAAATAAAARVARRHAPIRGVIEEASGSPWSGRAYHAQDPELLLWVHATLVDTSLLVFRSLVRPLRPDEAERYYEESRVVGELLGIPRDVIPPTLEAFHDYFDRMVEGPVLHVGRAARTQCAELAQFEPSHSFVSIYGQDWGTRWARHVDRPAVKRSFSWTSHLLAAGMLPGNLREAYGYRWSRRDRASYRAIMALVRSTYRRLPESARFVPGYRAAVLRAERGDGPPVLRVVTGGGAGR